MQIVWSFWILALWGTSIWASFLIGESKNRGLAGVLLGILFGPVAVMFMYGIPAKRPETATQSETAAQPAPTNQPALTEREREVLWIGIGIIAFLVVAALLLSSGGL